MDHSEEEITKKVRRLHLDLALDRGPDKTYCPSEVAKLYAPNDWSKHMSLIRTVAYDLSKEGKLEVLQKGKLLCQKATEVRGPIRLRIKK